MYFELATLALLRRFFILRVEVGMNYLLLTRLGTSYATYHHSYEDFKREVSLIEKEYDLELNFIDPLLLDEEGSLDRYPEGTALAIVFDANFTRSVLLDVKLARSARIPRSTSKPTIEYPKLASDDMEQGIYVGDAETETYFSPFSGKKV